MDHNEIFEREGYRFRFSLEDDGSMGWPWNEHDGHGSVRTVRYQPCGQITKSPGERVLWENGSRHHVFLYDWKGAIALAKKDGWGASVESTAGLTPGRIAELAVQADFNRMRGYINEDWRWIGVVVELLGEEDEVVDTTSLWGIESDSNDYHQTVAFELADELLAPRIEAAKQRDLQREINLAEVD